MKTILVPIDFSTVTQPVLSAAVHLARLWQGNLCLINVVQPPAVVASDFAPISPNIESYMQEAKKSAKHRLAQLQEKLQSTQMAVTIVQMMGQPAECILEIAQKQKADYIVIGSHGHTAFYDLVVGSTARTVLKRATCPVLVVPAPRKAKAPSRRKR